MRPLDVARNMYLDYSATQSIKFYNKGVEKLPGEAFNGKLLLTWLIQVQDKANMFTWTSILTINGKPLTQNITKITMEEVWAHSQVYQDRSLREAQNSEMLIQCLKASVARTVHNLKEEYQGTGGRWRMFLEDNHWQLSLKHQIFYQTDQKATGNTQSLHEECSQGWCVKVMWAH